MNNIDTIMRLLNWNCSKIEQEKGIAMAREVRCIKVFFQPPGPDFSKSVWENCARIVCEKKDDELIPYTTDMLMWIQDLTWPGAERILLRLQEFSDTSVLAMTITEMLPALIAIEEIPWIMSIACLLCNDKLKRRLSISVIDQLSSYGAMQNQRQ